jgi:hypothetical protein
MPYDFDDDNIVCARMIGLPINRAERQTRHLIGCGRLPAKNHDGSLSALVGDLRAACGGGFLRYCVLSPTWVVLGPMTR